MLNPNSATAWMLGGFLHAFAGEPDRAIEHFARAMRLSPLDPEMFRMQTGTAFAHLAAERYEVAASWAERSVRDLAELPFRRQHHRSELRACRPRFAAQRAMARLRELDPTLRASNLRDWIPLRGANHVERFTDGLRKAGLPE
jgi:hypothetical protein